MTVIPIRNIRRKLKGARTLIEPGQQEAYRTKLKAIELEAERLQQQAMFAFSQAQPLGKETDPRSGGARQYLRL